MTFHLQIPDETYVSNQSFLPHPDEFPFTIETLDITDTRIEITWGQHQSVTLRDYEVICIPNDGTISRPVISSNELRVATFYNLQPDKPYQITVWARDYNGNSLEAATRTVKTCKSIFYECLFIQYAVLKRSSFLWPVCPFDFSANSQIHQIVRDISVFLTTFSFF